MERGKSVSYPDQNAKPGSGAVPLPLRLKSESQSRDPGHGRPGDKQRKPEFSDQMNFSGESFET